MAGLICLGGLTTYYYFNAQVRGELHLYQGLAIVTLGFLPALLWAKRGEPHLPVFETFLLTFINAYAFPLLNGHDALLGYAEDDISKAAAGVLTFQLAAIAAHQLVRGRPRESRFWREEVLSQDARRWLSYGMALNSAYVIVSTFTTAVPTGLTSVLRAIFFGIGIVCTFIMSRRLGSGELSRGERIFFFFNLALQCAGMISTLFLVGAVSQLLLALVGYVSASGRLPWLTCTVALLLIAVLHNGKAAMRSKYWEEGVARSTPSLTQLPAFMGEWLRAGLALEQDEEANARMTSKLIERTSLFHIMCLVTSVTPDRQPFLHGETYRDIPGQFIPRLLWPNKPPGHVSTSKLSVYYGLQTEEDTQKTTIGFGVVSEAYANFGFIGLVVVGAIIGAAVKKVGCWSSQSPLLSYGGLLVVILLAWSFQVEFTMSIWLASFYQACIAVLAMPFALRTFLRQ